LAVGSKDALKYPAGSFNSGWCPALDSAAKKLGRRVSSEDLTAHPELVHPGMLFLVRGEGDKAKHVGVAMSFDVKNGVFESIEGNASDPTQGSVDRVHRRFRNYRAAPYYFINLD
jgi:hypothetical protein